MDSVGNKVACDVDYITNFSLMRDAANIADFRRTILFGQHDLGDAGHGEAAAVMSLPDDAEICGCNGVSKGDIVQAISKNGIFTLDEVRAHTKASSSCGSCTGLVESILASTVGEGYDATPSKKAICSCTDCSHDEVIDAIKDHELKTMPAVREFLEIDRGQALAQLASAWMQSKQLNELALRVVKSVEVI